MHVALEGPVGSVERRPAWLGARAGAGRRRWDSRQGFMVFFYSENHGKGVGNNVMISFVFVGEKYPSRCNIESELEKEKVVVGKVKRWLQQPGEQQCFPRLDGGCAQREKWIKIRDMKGLAGLGY